MLQDKLSPVGGVVVQDKLFSSCLLLIGLSLALLQGRCIVEFVRGGRGLSGGWWVGRHEADWSAAV